MSLSCLKKTVGFFAFIVACAGIAVIVVMSILLSDSGSSSLWQASGVNFGKAVTIGTLVIGVLLFLLGIQGIYGGCKRSRCCLTFYQFGIMLICAAFIAAGVCSSIYFAEFSDDVQNQIDINNKYCSYEQFQAGQCNDNCGKASSMLNNFFSINENINLIGEYFGHNDNCQIYASSQTIETQVSDYQLTKEKFLFAPNQNLGNINIEKCKSSSPNEVQQAINQVSSLMVFLESTFKCSGMCQPYSYYMFTDVNNSPSNVQNKPCFNALQTFLNDYSLEIQLVSYITGSLLLINVIMVFVLCCKKDKKEGNVYTRMDYLD